MTALPRVCGTNGAATRHRHTFSRRASVIFAGSALGQGIAVIVLPVIAQIYDAQVLGRAATVLVIVNISALIMCLQYDHALIVAPGTDLPYLLILSTAVAAGWAVLLGGLLLLDAKGFCFGRRHLLAGYGITWILPLLVFIYGLFTLLVNLGLRRNTLFRVSAGRLIYYGGGSLIQVMSGFLFGPSEHVFLVAQALAALIAIVCLMPYRPIAAWMSCHFGTKDMITGVGRVARTYIKFPKYQMCEGFVSAVSMYMPVVFLRVAFSDAWAGWYYVAWRLLAAPTTLVAQAIGQVFYRDSAERERGGMEQGRLAENVVAGLMRVSILATLAVSVGAPMIVDVLLGNDWGPVTDIVRAILIAAAVTFFTAPVAMLLAVKGLQAHALRYASVLFAVALIGLGLGWYLQSEMACIWGYSVLRAVVLLSFLVYIIRSVDGRLTMIVKRVVPMLVDSILIATIVILLWLIDVLYTSYGILGVSVLLSLALWRDVHRGGWRVA